MSDAEILVNQTISFEDNKYVAHIKVFKVTQNLKFPDGLKVRCVLIDQDRGLPLLILDNHEPFGYHIHTKLPEIVNFRVSIIVNSYVEAIEIFLRRVKKLVNHGK